MNNNSLICKTTRYGAAICMAVPIGYIPIPIMPRTAYDIWRRISFEGKYSIFWHCIMNEMNL